MIYGLGKVSLGIFTWFPKYWTYIPLIGWKIGFFEVKCHFWAFSHKWKNQFFVEYSTGVEISTVKFCEKKLMMFVDIPNKYLELILITYENIQKINRVIFFSTSQYSINEAFPRSVSRGVFLGAVGDMIIIFILCLKLLEAR